MEMLQLCFMKSNTPWKQGNVIIQDLLCNRACIATITHFNDTPKLPVNRITSSIKPQTRANLIDRAQTIPSHTQVVCKRTKTPVWSLIAYATVCLHIYRGMSDASLLFRRTNFRWLRRNNASQDKRSCLFCGGGIGGSTTLCLLDRV